MRLTEDVQVNLWGTLRWVKIILKYCKLLSTQINIPFKNNNFYAQM